MTRSLGSVLAAVFLVVVLAAVPYTNCLHGDFVYDDKVSIQANADVIQADRIPATDLFLHDFWGNYMRMTWPVWLGGSANATKTQWTHSSYRPLTVLTFRWNWVTWGSGPTSFHVTNIAIHAAACVMALYAAVGIVGPARWWHAVVAACLFALHPIHTEVVTNLTGRCETLGGVFVLASMGVYLHMTRSSGGRPASTLSVAGGMLAAMALIILGTMCKETTLVVPAILMCLEVACNTTAEARQSSFGRYVWNVVVNANWWRILGLGLFQIALLYIRVVVVSSGYSLNTSILHNPIAAVTDAFLRRASFAYIQVFAMTMLVLPLYLSHEHNAMDAISGLSDPRLMLVLFVWAVVGWLFYLCASRRASDRVSDLKLVLADSTLNPTDAVSRRGRILAALAVIVVAYIPASHMLIHVAFVLAERSLFIPSFGAALLIPEVLLTVAVRLWPATAQDVSDVDGAVPLTDENEQGQGQAQGQEVQDASQVDDAPTTSPAGTDTSQSVPTATTTKPPTAATPTSTPTTTLTGKATSSKADGGRVQCRWRFVHAWLVLFALFFGARTMRRNLDWQTEPDLLLSNLEIYPRNNPMSLYGLGAKAMYAGELDKAHDYLTRSITAAPKGATFAEPHILLSQLYWNKQHGGEGYLQRAIDSLEQLVAMKSAKREFFSNLGLLLYATKRDDPEVLKRAEYLVLLAAQGHALGPNDPNLGIVYNNAGCFRVLSHPDRYGHGALAEGLFKKAAATNHPQAARNAYANLSMLYALHGRLDDAIVSLQNAAFVAQSHDDGQLGDDMARYQQFANSLAANEATIRSWASNDRPPVGPLGQARMDAIGANCKTLLLYM